jgi:hypothetical protein
MYLERALWRVYCSIYIYARIYNKSADLCLRRTSYRSS